MFSNVNDLLFSGYVQSACSFFKKSNTNSIRLQRGFRDLLSSVNVEVPILATLELMVMPLAALEATCL